MKARVVLLTVTFDIDQDSQLLQWSFTANGEPITGSGVETGLLAFQLQDKVSLRVIAKSGKKQLEQVEIQDCRLISAPRAFTVRQNPERAGQFAAPSPFALQNAVVSFGQGTCVGSGSEAVWASDVTFECSNQGRWDLSFIMTTAISRSGEQDSQPERRVFLFDPEGEVGSGY